MESIVKFGLGIVQFIVVVYGALTALGIAAAFAFSGVLGWIVAAGLVYLVYCVVRAIVGGLDRVIDKLT
jgi:hypothetical protein